jgi:benzoyl-CoA-dihydrodiol lyase
MPGKISKFTNETRNSMEDSSRHEISPSLRSTVPWRVGYEMALARRDPDGRRSTSTVSLPEVPLLGVLPGTGRLTASRTNAVRRDLADVFCSTTEGVRADRARQWKLVDHIAKPQHPGSEGAGSGTDQQEQRILQRAPA